MACVPNWCPLAVLAASVRGTDMVFAAVASRWDEKVLKG